MLGNVAGREIRGQHGAFGAEGPGKSRRQGGEKHRRTRAMLGACIALGVEVRIGSLAVRVGVVIMVGLRLRGDRRIRGGAEADRDRGETAQRHDGEQCQDDQEFCSFCHGAGC